MSWCDRDVNPSTTIIYVWLSVSREMKEKEFLCLSSTHLKQSHHQNQVTHWVLGNFVPFVWRAGSFLTCSIIKLPSSAPEEKTIFMFLCLRCSLFLRYLCINTMHKRLIVYILCWSDWQHQTTALKILSCTSSGKTFKLKIFNPLATLRLYEKIKIFRIMTTMKVPFSFHQNRANKEHGFAIFLVFHSSKPFPSCIQV